MMAKFCPVHVSTPKAALRPSRSRRTRHGVPLFQVDRGALGDFLEALVAEADLEWLMIDSTIVRAHQHAAGARIAKGGLMLRDWAALSAA